MVIGVRWLNCVIIELFFLPLKHKLDRNFAEIEFYNHTGTTLTAGNGWVISSHNLSWM